MAMCTSEPLLLWYLSSKCHQNTLLNKTKISFPFNQLQMDAKIALIDL